MKKALLFVIFLSFLVCGCAKEETSVKEETTESETTMEAPKPLDLTGLWKSDVNEGAYMVATVRDDGKIGVFWMFEGDDVPYVYWIGTYEKPGSSVDFYEWISETTYGGQDLLASSDETKKFSYKDEELSFKLTIEGETGIISMKRGDWDDSGVSEDLFNVEKVDKSSYKEIEIKDTEWIVDDDYLYSVVTLYNPNDSYIVDGPEVRMTARDGEGIVLGTTNLYSGIIYPGQELVFGGLGFSVDEKPDTVEFEMLSTSEYSIKNIKNDDEFIPLEVFNTAVKSDKIVGEIYNPNTYDVGSALVTVVCRNSEGEAVFIDSTFVDEIKSDANTPFSIWYYGVSNIDSVEAYAILW